MPSQKELLSLRPPLGLSESALEKWWEKQICEPDGTLILNDQWVDESQPDENN